MSKIDGGSDARTNAQRVPFSREGVGEADNGDLVYLANIFHANDAAEMHKAIWPGLDIQPNDDGEKTHEVYLNAVKPLILPKGVWPAIGTRAQGVG